MLDLSLQGWVHEGIPRIFLRTLPCTCVHHSFPFCWFPTTLILPYDESNLIMFSPFICNEADHFFQIFSVTECGRLCLWGIEKVILCFLINATHANRIKLCTTLERASPPPTKHGKACNIIKASMVGDALNPSVTFISYNDGKLLKRNSYLNVPEVLQSQVLKVYCIFVVWLVGSSKNNTNEHLVCMTPTHLSYKINHLGVINFKALIKTRGYIDPYVLYCTPEWIHRNVHLY